MCKIMIVNVTNLQADYTVNGHVYQLVFPMDINEMIPADDSVRLLSAVLERMDYSKWYAAYSRMGEARCHRSVCLRSRIRIHEVC